MFKRFLVSFLCATMLVNSISVSSYASEIGELVVMEAESGEMTTEDVIEVANDIEELVKDGDSDINPDIEEVEEIEEIAIEDEKLHSISRTVSGQGKCGDNISWIMYYCKDDNNTPTPYDDEDWDELYLSGTGPMYDYDNANSTPWERGIGGNKIVSLSEGITTIGNYAFSVFSVREMPKLPSTLVSIGDYAFYNQVNMTGNLKLPDGLVSIGNHAFEWCGELSGDLTIPNSVTSVGEGAFYYCSSMTGHLELSNKMTEIPRAAFGRSGFSSVYIPPSIVKIGKDAFKLGGLKKLLVPNTVKEIDESAFFGCSKLSGDLIVPLGITEISDGVFGGCGYDGKLVIHNRITKIGGNAFQGCEKLKGNIVIPDSVTKIGGVAFSGCSSFTGDVIIPDSVTSLGGSAFYGCKGLDGKIVFPSSCKVIKSAMCFGCENITSVVWPEQLEVIEDSAFVECTKLAGEITLPATVKSIGTGSFLYTGIEKVNFEGDEPSVREVGYLWGQSFESKIIICYEDGRNWNVDVENHLWNGYTAYKKGELPPVNVTFVSPEGSEISGYESGKRVVTIQTNGLRRIENIPKPVMEGKNFMGWYYTVDGEEKIVTENTTFSDDTTVFAKFLKLYGCTDFDFSKDVFTAESFKDDVNNDHGYLWNYKLLDRLMEQVGPLSKYKINVTKIGNDIKVQMNAGGWCYGSSVMMGLLYKGYFSPSMFNAASVSAIEPGDDLNALITYFFLSQQVYQIDSSSNGKEAELGKRLVDTLLKNGGPCVVSFETSQTQHAVLAYALDKDSYSDKYVVYLADPSAMNKIGVDIVLPHLLFIDKKTYKYIGEQTGNGAVANSLGKIIRVVDDIDIFYDLYANASDELRKNGSIYTNMKNFKVYDANNEELSIEGPFYTSRAEQIATEDMASYYVEDRDYYRIVYEGEKAQFMMTCDGDVTMSGVNSNAAEFIVSKDLAEIKGATGESVLTVCSKIDGDYCPINIRTRCENLVVESKEDTIVLESDDIIGTIYASVEGGIEKKIVIEDTSFEEAISSINIGPEEGLDGLRIEGISEEGYVYSGTANKPVFDIYYGQDLLVANRDYSVTYKNNINAYTLSEEDENFNFAKAPTITVTGKGNYSGKIVKTFVINPREISECEVADIVVLENGKLQKSLPVVTTVVNGKKVTLKNNSDYTLSYPDERDGAYQNEGEYEIVITGKGNYIGTKSVTETIAANKTLISKVSVKAIPTQTYTGKPIEPVITVSNGKTPMTLGFDYDVEYKNHTEIGTATVVITGKGSYIGTKTVSFKIVGTAITKCAVDYTNAFIYSGSAITPETNANFKVYIKATKTASEIPLTKGKDFEITYQNNVKVGTGTMIITGINGYSGTLKKTFKINPFDIANDTNGRVTVEPIGSVAYQKGGVKPVVNVKDTVSGDTLVAGKDYSVAYVNNKKVNDGSDARTCPTVKITGKGNYKGTRSVIFKIINNDIINTNVTATDFVYANKPGVCKTKVVVTDSDGTKLVAGVDYDKNITLTYSDGTAVDLVNDIIDVGTEIKATVKALPTSPYYSEGGFNENYATFRCVKNDLAKATVKIPAQTYTGKAIELSDADITVAFGKEEPLVAGTDYKVVGYTNNTNKGTAKVTLEGIGNYGGTKTVLFSITQRSMNYTIVYDKNADDAIGTMKDSSIATGTKLTRCAYKRDGDTFIGWNTKKDGSGISYNDGETFRIKSIFQIFGTKEVLYAQWASGTQSE